MSELDKYWKEDYTNLRGDLIEGVSITSITWHHSDDGSFCEVLTSLWEGELQINHSILLPGSIKGAHLHKKQCDRFYCFEPLLVGLKDEREDSSTYGNVMRFNLCNQRLFIPNGVSHAISNLSTTPRHLFYIVDKWFSLEEHDEWRRDYKEVFGEDFFNMRKG